MGSKKQFPLHKQFPSEKMKIAEIEDNMVGTMMVQEGNTKISLLEIVPTICSKVQVLAT